MRNRLDIERGTYGEQKITELLSTLPKPDFTFYSEVSVRTDKGFSLKPDFVLVAHKQGVIVIEVKDWITITRGTQKEVHIERRDGREVVERNPLEIARNYAYSLESRFLERTELCHYYRGKIKLKFPWQVAVILPNIS